MKCGVVTRINIKLPIREILLVAAILSGISGCSDEEMGDKGYAHLPPVIRYATDPGLVEGVSRLPKLEDLDYDLFQTSIPPFLDDTFSDPDLWQGVGPKSGVQDEFPIISFAEGSDGRAMEIGSKELNFGRLVPLPQLRPMTICVRVKLPPGLTLKAFGSILRFVQVRNDSKLVPAEGKIDLTHLDTGQYLEVHDEWRRVVKRGDWIDLIQVFLPKGSAKFLLAQFQFTGADRQTGDTVLVDRLSVRPATLLEAASTYFASDSAKEGPPHRDIEMRRENRSAFITASKGFLKFPIESGGLRVLRFGLAFPFMLSIGHTRRVRLSVERSDGHGMETRLHEEVLPFAAGTGKMMLTWMDRAIKIPPSEGKAEITLKCESLEGGGLVAAWGSPCLVSPSTPGAPPNIVLISIDTLRADKLGAYGAYHPEGISPFLDRIAEESLLFENAHTQAPYTLPSHVSMLSGQYPSVHRVLDPKNRIDPQRCPLITPFLASRGYVTGAFTGGLLVSRTFGFGDGFDLYSEKDPCHGNNLERVLDWLRANKSLPFFLFFHTYAVHDYAWDDPRYVPRFDPSRSKRNGHFAGFSKNPNKQSVNGTPTLGWEEQVRSAENMYFAGVRMVDDSLKTLVGCLESMGILENTLLVITSDHGEELFERGNLQHGRTLYQEQTHIPLLIRLPGGVPARRVPDLVELIDVTPTILDCLAFERFPNMQGMSLLPFASPSQVARGKDLVFSEVDYRKNLYALRTKEWKIIHHPRFKDTPGQAIEEYEVYHLASDPEELKERSDETAPIDQLRRSLSQFRKHLEALSASLGGNDTLESEIDPELIEELRAQGYLK